MVWACLTGASAEASPPLIVIAPPGDDPISAGLVAAAEARGPVLRLAPAQRRLDDLRALLDARGGARLLKLQAGPPQRLMILDPGAPPWAAPFDGFPPGTPASQAEAARLRADFLLSAPKAPIPTEPPAVVAPPRPQRPALPPGAVADLKPGAPPPPPPTPTLHLPPIPRDAAQPPAGLRLNVQGPPGPLGGGAGPPLQGTSIERSPSPARRQDDRGPERGRFTVAAGALLGAHVGPQGALGYRHHLGPQLALGAEVRGASLPLDEGAAWRTGGALTGHWALLRLPLTFDLAIGVDHLSRAAAPWSVIGGLGLTWLAVDLGPGRLGLTGRLEATPAPRRGGDGEIVLGPAWGLVGLYFSLPLADEDPGPPARRR